MGSYYAYAAPEGLCEICVRFVVAADCSQFKLIDKMQFRHSHNSSSREKHFQKSFQLLYFICSLNYDLLLSVHRFPRTTCVSLVMS